MGTVNWEWKNWDLYRKKLKLEADQIGKKIIKRTLQTKVDRLKKKIAKFRNERILKLILNWYMFCTVHEII